jgi:hypothetical protein
MNRMEKTHVIACWLRVRFSMFYRLLLLCVVVAVLMKGRLLVALVEVVL